MRFSFEISRTKNKSITESVACTASNVSRSLRLFAFGEIKTKILLAEELLAYYHSVPYYSMCVDRIAEMASTIKFDFKSKFGTDIKNSRIRYRMENCSKYDTFGEIFRKVITSLEACGEAFAFYDDEQNLTFCPITDCNIYIDKYNRITKIVFSIGSGTFKRLYSEVWHLRFASIVDQFRGRGKAASSEALLSGSMEAHNIEAFTFKNRGATTFLANKSAIQHLPSETIEAENEIAQRTAGSDKSGRVTILEGDYVPLKIFEPLKDMLLDKAKESYKRDICDLFGLDIAIFNDTSSKTYNNKSEAIKQAYTDVFIPIATYVMNEFCRFVESVEGVKEYAHPRIEEIECFKVDHEKAEIEKRKEIIESVKAGILTAVEAKKMMYDDNNDDEQQ